MNFIPYLFEFYILTIAYNISTVFIYDYFNIPIQGSDGLLKGSFDVNALPLRSYNLIYDEKKYHV